MSTMLAAFYKPGNDQVVLENVAIPEPGPKEVLIKVKACGVCHSDVFLLTEYPDTRNYIMGHETAGIVVKVGADVDSRHVEVGKLYAVYIINGCARRPAGVAPLIDSFGIGMNGGYAEYAIVSPEMLVAVPQGVPAHIAAVCADAGTTAYHAVHSTANVQKGQRVLIVGAGGLGLFGVQYAKHFGATVYVLDRRPDHRALAKQFGATDAFDLADMAVQTAKGFQVDTVIDFAAATNAFNAAYAALTDAVQKWGGRGLYVMVGVSNDDLPISSVSLITNNISVLANVYGTRDDLREFLKLVAEGIIKPQVEVEPLEKVNVVLHELRAGQIRSRKVVVPGNTD